MAECALLGERRQKCLVLQVGEYDLAGFCVGIVEKSQPWMALRYRETSPLAWQVRASTNGFSLVRKIVDERALIERLC